jgi:type IV pilus assembly protein PilO
MGLLPKDPQKQKKILVGVLPIVVAVMYWNFLYVPKTLEIEELEARVETVEASNNSMRVIVARFGTDLPRRLAIFEEHVRQLEELIPRSEDVPVLIHQITQRAYDTGVELALIRPGEEQKGEHYALQTFELQVVGEYHDIGSYLTSIGSLGRIVRPFDLSMAIESTLPRSRDGAPKLRASFRIETYVMPLPSTAEANNATT